MTTLRSGRSILAPRLSFGRDLRTSHLDAVNTLNGGQAGLAGQNFATRCFATSRPGSRRVPRFYTRTLLSDSTSSAPGDSSGVFANFARRNPFLPSLALLPFSLDSLPSLSTLTSPLSDFLLTHPTLGSFSLTIVLITLSLRTFVTLPASLWARARTRRMRRLVAPEMREWNEVLAKKVAGESRRQNLGYEGYKKELKRQLAAQQSLLVKEHKCHPFLTAIAPIAVHVPSFILLSLGIRGAVAKAQEREVLLAENVGAGQTNGDTLGSRMLESTAQLDPSIAPDLGLGLDVQLTSPLTHAFATEPFFHCPTLVDPDPTLIVPFMIGLAVFANVEVMVAWREGLREMREDKGELGKVAMTPRGQAGGKPSTTTSKPSSDEVIDKGRDWMGRRIVQVKARAQEDIPKFATSSINAPLRGSKSRTKTPYPNTTNPVLQDETDVCNMTPEEIKSRGLRIETATLRERIVGNVLRGFAVVVVGIATEMPVAVAIYWLTSTTYTLVQNWIFGWSDRREERAIKLASLAAASPVRSKRVL